MKLLDKVIYQGREIALADVAEMLQFICESNKLFCGEFRVFYLWVEYSKFYPHIEIPTSQMDVTFKIELLVNDKPDLISFNTIEDVNKVLLQMVSR